MQVAFTMKIINKFIFKLRENKRRFIDYKDRVLLCELLSLYNLYL